MPVIKFVCPVCHATIKAPEQAAGKTALCPRCKEKCRVPNPVPENGGSGFQMLPSAQAIRKEERTLVSLHSSRSPSSSLFLSLALAAIALGVLVGTCALVVGWGIKSPTSSQLPVNQAQGRLDKQTPPLAQPTAAPPMVSPPRAYKDHGSATPAAMPPKKDRETRYVKGRRSEDGETARATVRMRALEKKQEALMQKEERVQAQFDELFKRGREEDIEFTTYASAVAEGRLDKKTAVDSYGRVRETDRQILAALQELLTIQKDIEKVVQERMYWEADPDVQALLKEFSAVLRNNIRKEEGLLTSIKDHMQEREKLKALSFSSVLAK